MENYKVELAFKFKFDQFPCLVHCYCTDGWGSKFCDCYYKSDQIIDSIFEREGYDKYNTYDYIRKKISTFNFKASQFNRVNFLRKKHWNEYHEIFKKHLPDMYQDLENEYIKDLFRWKLKFPKYEIKAELKLVCVTLLKRSLKVIFKKVFANIVLKSLLSDIYKPGSKRFQKCQERFLENSNRIK